MKASRFTVRKGPLIPIKEESGWISKLVKDALEKRRHSDPAGNRFQFSLPTQQFSNYIKDHCPMVLLKLPTFRRSLLLLSPGWKDG
jgi:hypothetical protein